MFTGIVQGVGRVRSVEPRDGDVRMWIDTGAVPLGDVTLGGSIAVNGCCLTAIELEPAAFAADLSRETLSLTTAGDWQSGTPVNLEKALTAGQALGGHYVTGHVDGVGEVIHFAPVAGGDGSWRLDIRAPGSLGRYLAPKGSIAVNGVSLTVNRVQGSEFSINLIPHTLEQTMLKDLKPGSRVNLEADMLARYADRLLHYVNEQDTQR